MRFVGATLESGSRSAPTAFTRSGEFLKELKPLSG